MTERRDVMGRVPNAKQADDCSVDDIGSHARRREMVVTFVCDGTPTTVTPTKPELLNIIHFRVSLYFILYKMLGLESLKAHWPY
jgi:hypothetical protein